MMNKSTNIAKTVAVVMIVGGALSATAAVLGMPKRNSMQKMAKKAWNSITSAVDNIVCSVR